MRKPKSTVKQPPRIVRSRVRFHMAAQPGSRVFVAGTFNDWNATKHPLQPVAQDGLCGATMLLAKGRHEYKFVVDGKWHVDPQCPDTVPNDHGSLNSVIHV